MNNIHEELEAIVRGHRNLVKSIKKAVSLIPEGHYIHIGYHLDNIYIGVPWGSEEEAVLRQQLLDNGWVFQRTLYIEQSAKEFEVYTHPKVKFIELNLTREALIEGAVCTVVETGMLVPTFEVTCV